MPRGDDWRASYSGRRVTELRRAVAAEYGSVCWLCRVPIVWEDYTVDHIVPRSRGGDPWDLGNCRPAHRSCNSSRQAGPPRPRTARLPDGTPYPLPSRIW